MSRTIKTWRDPYGEGFSTCRKREIEINPGVTVLVGCNGAGKTTLIKNLWDDLKKHEIPVLSYDNLRDGGTRSIGEEIFSGNVELAATAYCSSEGENISLNLNKFAGNLREFIQTGRVVTKFSRLADAMSGREKKEITSKERWILLDAMDSGYSIDNVIEMKDFFDLVLEDGQKFGMEVYIVISSNEYELACGADCFDVTSGKYVNFESYEEYKKFILKTREKKNKRYEKKA